MSTELIQKVDLILQENKLPERHTYFQLEKFIVGKEPTGQSQLWQIIRELDSRRESVESYHEQLKDCEDDLELFDIKIARLERKLEKIKNELNIRELKIGIRKLKRKKESLLKSTYKLQWKLKNIMEEMSYLACGYDKVKKVVGEVKPLDDYEAQKEYWNEKLLEEYNLRVLFGYTFEPEFVKTVLALEDGMSVKEQMVGLLHNIRKLQCKQQGKIEDGR